VNGEAVSDCTFCRIVAGDVPAAVVFADLVAVAFLDQRPLFFGHTLLVPREHHETLTDLPAHLVEPVFARVRRLAALMESALGAAGRLVAMNNTVSQSVPHLHVHVVPRNQKDGLRGFFWPRTTYERLDQAAQVAEVLGTAYHLHPVE